MTFKHIQLHERGARAFKEAKPEIKVYHPMKMDAYFKDCAYHEESGIEIEFYPGEEAKLNTHLVQSVPSYKITQGIDITDFCEIRGKDCKVAASGNYCPNMQC